MAKQLVASTRCKNMSEAQEWADAQETLGGDSYDYTFQKGGGVLVEHYWEPRAAARVWRTSKKRKRK